ncbi:MAG TPA: hypothetical protein VEZ13_04720 [Brevibacillus sp.]|nr:hypothetical protein [Brevibacillus sp.]
MLSIIVLTLDMFCLALILGGGIILAACVRPFLLRISTASGNPELITTVEHLSIQSWNRYNLYAMGGSVGLFLLDIVRLLAGLPLSYWHFAASLLMIVSFTRKLIMDRQLSERMQSGAEAAVESAEQRAGHREVEWLTKVILLLALSALFLSHMP